MQFLEIGNILSYEMDIPLPSLAVFSFICYNKMRV